MKLSPETDGLIAELRELRMKVAERRADDLATRYPEMRSARLEAATDDEIVKHALERDLAHQWNVARDLGLPTSVERGR